MLKRVNLIVRFGIISEFEKRLRFVAYERYHLFLYSSEKRQFVERCKICDFMPQFDVKGITTDSEKHYRTLFIFQKPCFLSPSRFQLNVPSSEMSSLVILTLQRPYPNHHLPNYCVIYSFYLFTFSPSTPH